MAVAAQRRVLEYVKGHRLEGAWWLSMLGQLRAQGDLISEAGVRSWIGRLRRSDGLPKAPYVGSGLMMVDELGQPLRPQYYSDLFEQLTKEAGLPPITDVHHRAVPARVP
ncbi:hypothetical protein E1263_00660 [Kribbella antibiotica]|uniref:Uncharacterized protein n=1 Tax=Kribbella antibiotica TaxID=190195 RepID=A0A4R5A208_9ACTN|nr:hypothetical protein [Kribbella antibiotica]TDD63492.1 hypothetical protein E1263_00660 [Kribbella antibiotica]